MERRFVTSASGVTEAGDMPQPAGPQPRMVVESFRLEVASYTFGGGGFQLLVHVNDVEMTAIGAGLGMDPYDVIIPTNRLVASSEPHSTPIARCDCGSYGCGATDITITRSGDRVHWDWLIEAPIDRGVSFDGADYAREVDRVASDHSWETAERTAGRLVFTEVDRNHLRRYGLAAEGASNFYRDSDLFRVGLRIDNDYQVFVDTPWRGRSPQQLAAAVCARLAESPDQWDAAWHGIPSELRSTPPAIAGRHWRPFRLDY